MSFESKVQILLWVALLHAPLGILYHFDAKRLERRKAAQEASQKRYQLDMLARENAELAGVSVDPGAWRS